MIEPNDVQDLVRILQTDGVTLFECDAPDGRLRLRFAAGGPALQEQDVPQEKPAPEKPAPAVQRAPGMGFLHLQHPLAGQPLLVEGETVAQGQIVAILQADDVLYPVEADREGIVGQILVREGDVIGYGSALFEWRGAHGS